MILPDVNVLIYAFRDDVPEHSVCRPWLDATILDESHFGISPLALNAFVRITTNARFSPKPSTLDEAFGFCEALPGQPHCHTVEPGKRQWSTFGRLCLQPATRARRVTDAWLAAL